MEVGDFLLQRNLYSVLSPLMLRSNDCRYVYSLRYSFSIERVFAKLSSASSQSGQVSPACSSGCICTLLDLLITGRAFFYLLDQLEASPRPFASHLACQSVLLSLISMHHLNSLLAIAPSLLLCLLTPSYAHIPADTLRSDHLRLPPFRLPQPLSQPQDPRTLLIRWRDRIIRSLWSVPESQCRIKATRQGPASKASPPQSLLSRYGGDMVLRFNVSSADEAKALAEAIDVLILDVWEFTTDWVDIRLSRDIVSFYEPIFQKSKVLCR
jgi:hypothetical protein